MPIANPKLVLAVAASVAPVPPFANDILLLFHVPVAMVPRVVIFEEPLVDPETCSHCVFVLFNIKILPSFSESFTVATIPGYEKLLFILEFNAEILSNTDKESSGAE